MKYSKLVQNGADKAEIQAFLSGGDTTAITLRIPENLKTAAQEAAAFKGVSFSAFIRMLLIEELTEVKH